MLRGLRAYIQNVTTMIALVGRDYEAAVRNFNNAEAKILDKKLKKMQNSHDLVKPIGIMMLLEKYALTSVIAQSSKRFPSQVWHSILQTQAVLEMLAENWTWSEEDLRLSCVEAPKKVVQRIVETRMYRPKILRTNLKSRKDLEDANLIEQDQDFDDLFDEDDDPVRPLAGEVLMMAITQEDVRDRGGIKCHYRFPGRVLEEETAPDWPRPGCLQRLREVPCGPGWH